MSTLKRIFVDLDDVLNQFTLHALQSVGCPVGPFDYHLFNPKWGFDIVAAANGLLPDRVFTPESFWGSIGKDVWVSAPISPYAEDLLHACELFVGRENVIILSCPTKDPECMSGKLEWIHANMPAWIHRQFLIGPCKDACGKYSSLLIDDNSANVHGFICEAGAGVLVPRPWNNLHYKTDKAHETVINEIRRIAMRS